MTGTNRLDIVPPENRRQILDADSGTVPEIKRESAETLSPSNLERQKSLELSTSTLARLRSTN
jgi:hypothetical protein